MADDQAPAADDRALAAAGWALAAWLVAAGGGVRAAASGAVEPRTIEASSKLPANVVARDVEGRWVAPTVSDSDAGFEVVPGVPLYSTLHRTCKLISGVVAVGNSC